MFYIVLPTLRQRQAMIEYLNERGINSVFIICRCTFPRWVNVSGKEDCPVTEYVSDRLLRLPFHNHLSEGPEIYSREYLQFCWRVKQRWVLN
jgi:dTDP-4-amino-4,6-dideoxygalactose transaminase